MRRVMIGTPAYDGTVGVHFAHSLVNTVRLGMEVGIDIRAVYMPHDALIQRSRNDLIRIALESGVDDLIFIDSDQEWKPEWVIRLILHQVDCVGGAVRKKSDIETYNVKAASTDIPINPATGLMEVEGLGTGFIRLSRKAMAALWNQAEEYRDDSGRVSRWIFDVRPINGRLVGEDIFMTMMLRNAGIPVYLDPAVTCSHVGTKKWDGDFSTWLKKLNMD